jgi:hypothetical protein
MGYLYDACDQISDLYVDFYTHWTYMHIVRHIFLSNYWWQRSDIWSQASYRYSISWEAFLDPSDSYFLFADFVDFSTHWTYIVGIWRVKKRFPRYGVPIWSLWPNIRFLPSIVAEKNATKNEHISYFLFADLVGFYTHWTYMHIFRRIFLSNYWWQESDI